MSGTEIGSHEKKLMEEVDNAGGKREDRRWTEKFVNLVDPLIKLPGS
jgi:hypothetical protein